MRFLLAVLFLFSASAIAQDVTAPVISNALPSGPVPYGTTSVIRRVTTDENATCKISTTDVPYADMPTIFTNTGGVSHSTSSFTVTNGTSYTRYIRCIDEQGNANTTSAVMTWNVQAGPAPVMSNPLPSSRQSYSTVVTLQVTTDVSATCRYSVSDVPYSEMVNTFSSTGGTSHSNPNFAVLTNIGNTVYLKCSTVEGYVNTVSTMANFSVAGLVDVPAFPGAEGGGAMSVGGRGGYVCEVTNTNGTGTGSLKACIDRKGPRTVIFKVGGTINLGNPLFIVNPYITIAGQTAPGGGIQIKGNNGFAGLRINTHDVVIRDLRVRKGYRLNSNADSVSIETSTEPGALRAENIVLDHVSIFWGSDEILGIWGTSTAGGTHIPNRISIQNSIIAEAFKSHPAGLLTGSDSRTNSELMINIDAHKNLFAHIGYRSPLFKNHHSRFINNIVYHWGLFASVAGHASFDFIGNLYKHPRPSDITFGRRYEIMTYLRDPVGCETNQGTGPELQSSIYAVGNSGPWHPDPNTENYVARINCHAHGVHQGPLSAEYRRSSPLPPAGVPISVMPVTSLESTLLPIVGASRRLDCMGNWVSNRDAADVRVVDNALTNFDPEWGDVYGSSTYAQFGPAHQDDVGGFPTIAAGTPCTDTDSDGMPDEWETARGLNPNDPSDRNTIHASGYTMLEMYLAGPVSGPPLMPPANLGLIE